MHENDLKRFQEWFGNTGCFRYNFTNENGKEISASWSRNVKEPPSANEPFSVQTPAKLLPYLGIARLLVTPVNHFSQLRCLFPRPRLLPRLLVRLYLTGTMALWPAAGPRASSLFPSHPATLRRLPNSAVRQADDVLFTSGGSAGVLIGSLPHYSFPCMPLLRMFHCREFIGVTGVEYCKVHSKDF